jgi:hypothetical protein
MNKEIIKKKIEHKPEYKQQSKTTHKVKYKPEYRNTTSGSNKQDTTEQTSNFVYALDRYTNKNIKVLNIDKKISDNLKA